MADNLVTGVIILNGQKISVQICYEKHYFLCPFCGKPVVFKEYNERLKKYSATIPTCANCRKTLSVPLLKR